MDNIVVVGTGEYGINLLGPTLAMLTREGRTEVIATVDVNERPETPHYTTEHMIRSPEQSLSALLAKLRERDPVVILGHSNELHTPDTLDLVAAGYRVLTEKPFATSLDELAQLQKCIDENPGKVALPEYYLMMKSAPVLIVAGLINPLSFYKDKTGVIETLGPSALGWGPIHGKLEEMIGKPMAVHVEVLEGEKKQGGTGRVDHRGHHLVDMRKGGGMIHDLGVHAVSIVCALESYLGKPDTELSSGIVRVARCQEYIDMATSKHKIPLEHIGESYAEIDMETSTGIPVYVKVGKYVLDNKNQRRFIIIGDRGILHHDLSACTLSVIQGDNNRGNLLRAPKLPDSKYYPVIRASLELISQEHQYDGSPPFVGFDATKASLDAQALVLHALNKAYNGRTDVKTYASASATPKDIF